MSLLHTSDKIGQRLDEVLADYSHTPPFQDVRTTWMQLYRLTNELLPASGEKTLMQRKLLEAAHLFTDAVETLA